MQDKEVSEQKLEGKEVPSIDINDILEELPEEKRKVIVATVVGLAVVFVLNKVPSIYPNEKLDSNQ